MFCSHLGQSYCEKVNENGNSFMFSTVFKPISNVCVSFEFDFFRFFRKLTGYVWFPAYVWIRLRAGPRIAERYHFFLLVLCAQRDVHSRQFYVVPKIEPPNPPLEHQCRVRSHPVKFNTENVSNLNGNGNVTVTVTMTLHFCVTFAAGHSGVWNKLMAGPILTTSYMMILLSNYNCGHQ